MDTSKNPDDLLLDEDFDEECKLPVIKKEKCPDDDTADAFDIFPAYLSAESKFYPKSWK